MRERRRGGLVALVLLLASLLVPTTAYAATSTSTGTATGTSTTPLPTGTDVDYQLGGNRSVPDHVGIVVRDRAARPAAGRYNVCYVNGFQTQSDERGFWEHHLGLVLQQHGKPVRDSAWDEWLLDLRTPAKRQHLARIVGRWVTGCAADGFDAVEFDNLDSYTRSHGLMTRKQGIAFARLLVQRAHAAGLQAAQKNLAGFDGTSIGYDFAIAEECGRYRECSSYTRYYGDRVLAIEYRPQDFRWTCEHFGDRLPVVLRDLALSPSGVRRWC